MSTKSRIANPVARVWAIASKMPRAPRKDVLAACAKAGIAARTADTQYYHWKNATPKQRKTKIAV